MRHIKQSYPTSCGAASFAMVVGISESAAIWEVKTTNNGTFTSNVKLALTRRGLNFLSISIDNDYKCVQTHLKLLSNQYKIYVSAEFVSGGGRGRNTVRSHAFVIWRGYIYDPADSHVCPLDCNGHSYNKNLLIKEILLISS